MEQNQTSVETKYSYNPLFIPPFNEILSELDAEPNEKNKKIITTIQDLIELSCEETGINKEQLKSKSRKREIVYPRNVICYMAYMNLKMALREIGVHFGGRDHSTIIHGRDSVMNAIDNPRTNTLLLQVYLNISSRCVFVGSSFNITHVYEHNKWMPYLYRKQENVIISEQYKASNGVDAIIQGEIREMGVVIKSGMFRGRYVNSSKKR